MRKETSQLDKENYEGSKVGNTDYLWKKLNCTPHIHKNKFQVE